MTIEQYVTGPEAARRLQIRTDEMCRILRSGKLPGAFKCDGMWKVPVAAVEARIEARAERLARRSSLATKQTVKI